MTTTYSNKPKGGTDKQLMTAYLKPKSHNITAGSDPLTSCFMEYQSSGQEAEKTTAKKLKLLLRKITILQYS